MITNGSGRNGEAVLHVAYKDGVCGEKWGEILKLPKTSWTKKLAASWSTRLTEKSPNLRAQCISIGTKVHGKRIFPEGQLL